MAKCSVCGYEFKLRESFNVYEHNDVEFPFCNCSVCTETVEIFETLTNNAKGSYILAARMAAEYAEAKVTPEPHFDYSVKNSVLIALWLIQNREDFNSAGKFKLFREELKGGKR